MTEKAISLKLSVDSILVKKTVFTKRIVEIALKAPLADIQLDRTPVNLALVIDRSGSMGGGKLEDAKRAAIHVVDLLKDTDHIAVVVYDDSVDVLASSVPATAPNRAEIKEAIRRLHTGGSTNLGGGWLAGCQLISATMVPGQTNRCLLLTDGMANVGIVDPAELALHARELHHRGVSTSTFGLGEGFNEHLLEAMANQGGGKFYYISSAREIPAIFALELGELTAMVAHGVEIHTTLPAGVTGSIPDSWKWETKGDHLTIFAGDMYSVQESEFYLRLQVPPFVADDKVKLTVKVTAKGGLATAAISEELVLAYAEDSLVDSAPVNEAMLARYAVVDVAESANEALKLERMGRRVEASAMLTQKVNENRPYMPSSSADLYHEMSQRMIHGMDENDRKSSHQQEYRDRKRFNK